MSRHNIPPVEVESSPDNRYLRFNTELGSGAYKEVYLAYDSETGREVAWNVVDLHRVPESERKRIRRETEILSSLCHPHIINFYHRWEDDQAQKICFTTEIVTSGTLKQYTNRVRSLKLKVVKKWCRQILRALHYLHSHSPPIIHRDLKCDNIFINGSTGEIRIGDFGLSATRHSTHVASVLGTPEFMAPELYDENYSESVDIYAFGMCVLEMTTKEYPFEECTNAAQIWKKVSGGFKPLVLQRIQDSTLRTFIELCLVSHESRLSAAELLEHPFLSFKRCDPVRDHAYVVVEAKDNKESPISQLPSPTVRPGAIVTTPSIVSTPLPQASPVLPYNSNVVTSPSKLTVAVPSGQPTPIRCNRLLLHLLLCQILLFNNINLYIILFPLLLPQILTNRKHLQVQSIIRRLHQL